MAESLGFQLVEQKIRALMTDKKMVHQMELTLGTPVGCDKGCRLGSTDGSFMVAKTVLAKAVERVKPKKVHCSVVQMEVGRAGWKEIFGVDSMDKNSAVKWADKWATWMGSSDGLDDGCADGPKAAAWDYTWECSSTAPKGFSRECPMAALRDTQWAGCLVEWMDEVVLEAVLVGQWKVAVKEREMELMKAYVLVDLMVDSWDRLRVDKWASYTAVVSKMAAEKDIGKVALSGSRKVLKKAVQRVYQKTVARSVFGMAVCSVSTMDETEVVVTDVSQAVP
eukprot:gene18177-18426_t